MVKSNSTVIKVPIKIEKTSDIDKEIDSVVLSIKKKFNLGIAAALLDPSTADPLVEACIDVLKQMQSYYFGGASSKEIDKDPTQFGVDEQFTKIAAEVRKNMVESASTVGSNGEFELKVLSEEFMGIGGSGDNSQGIPWLSFFLSGALDENLLWISSEVYAKLMEVNSGASSYSSLGRFGKGHMWHVKETSYPGINAWLEEAGLRYRCSDLLHPQSGKAGEPWFDGVVSKSGVAKIIMQKALMFVYK